MFVALDGIQDPHNLGAILRTCDCTGVQGVFITKHNSSPLTPTAIKASTGAAYTVPVSIVTNLSQTLRNLKKKDTGSLAVTWTMPAITVKVSMMCLWSLSLDQRGREYHLW